MVSSSGGGSSISIVSRSHIVAVAAEETTTVIVSRCCGPRKSKPEVGTWLGNIKEGFHFSCPKGKFLSRPLTIHPYSAFSLSLKKKKPSTNNYEPNRFGGREQELGRVANCEPTGSLHIKLEQSHNSHWLLQ